MKMRWGRLFVFALTVISIVLWAPYDAFADEEGSKDEATEYFTKRKKSEKTPKRTAASSASARYLSIHLGGFIDEDAYKWGKNNNDNIAKLNGGVSYRVGEWVNSMDLLFRADFTSFELREDKAVKMSLLPLLVFPDANSEFPLYFGGGVGLGVFFKQIENESSLALDYQLFAGVRLFNVFDNVGINFETGLKNHFHIFSDGQFNGYFLTVGTVFAF